jgi:hypothetical protein
MIVALFLFQDENAWQPRQQVRSCHEMLFQNVAHLVITPSNQSALVLRMYRSQQVSLAIKAKAVPADVATLLPITYTSPTSGFVTSLGYDRDLGYPISMESWRTIHIPEDHSGLVISFEHLNLGRNFPKDCLDLFIRHHNENSTRHVQRECARHPVPARVYSSCAMAKFVLVSSWSVQSRFSFKVLFSFHKEHMLPSTLQSGLFNCSGEDYPSFQQHVDCNLEVECHDGRDERGDCPFSSHACQGLIASGNKCLFYLPVSTISGLHIKGWENDFFSSKLRKYPQASWNQAADACVAHGGQLASIKTKEEWESLFPMWHFGKSITGHVLMGLKLN